MAKAWCLIPELAEKFKRGLASGEINPAKLNEMSSQDRRSLLEQYVGKENAKEVNKQFEKKLLLKNREQAMINWAKDVAGINDAKREALVAKIKENTATKEERILNPKEEEVFLEELAETRLGVGVTREESQYVYKLQQIIKTSKSASERGAARVAMRDYIGDLKLDARKQTIRERIRTPYKEIPKVAGFMKSVKSSLDNSFFGRQGLKVLFIKPGVWTKSFLNSWSNIAKTLKRNNYSAKFAAEAEIYSRENFENGTYNQMKLDLGQTEEAFPSSAPSKIPVLGRLFKASEVAYEVAALEIRANFADIYLDKASKQGVDIKEKGELESIGKLANSISGRGYLGKLEGASDAINAQFFSIRYLKSNFDTITAFKGQKVSPFVKKEAARNLARIVLGTAAILALAKALWPDSVEEDFRSADAGKIKIGNTRFDITGGMSSIAVLATRLAFGALGQKAKKSSVTGELQGINEGGFTQSGLDLIVDFFENKLSPMTSLGKELFITKQTFDGEPIGVDVKTFKHILESLYAPLPVTNFQELKDPNSAPKLLAVILDGLGFGQSTYGTWEDESPEDIYNILAPKNTSEQQRDAIRNLIDRGASETDIRGLLDKYYSDKEKQVKDPNNKNFQETKAEKYTDLDKLLRDYAPVERSGKFEDSDDAPKNSVQILQRLGKGIFVQPTNVLRAIFTKEQVRKIENGTVVLKREEGLGGLDDGDKESQVDHIIPLSLGGSNASYNLQVLGTEDHKKKTKIDNYVMKRVREGSMSRKDAVEITKKWRTYVTAENEVMTEKIEEDLK